MSEHCDKKVILIGAGPAGLTAAYELCKAGVQSVVLEKEMMIGGLAGTINYKGYLFDTGGHRFFTKVTSVEDMWCTILPDGDFTPRKRLSRIYYNKKFFYYPLRVTNALFPRYFGNAPRPQRRGSWRLPPSPSHRGGDGHY